MLDVLTEYCETTTSHGLGHIVRCGKNIFGAIWTLITIICFVTLFFFCYTDSMEFLSRKIISKVIDTT